MNRSLPARTAAILVAAAAFAIPHASAEPFTYQGQLQDTGAPADGIYDFRFSLYDAPDGGTQIGSTLTFSDVLVTDGVFTVDPDFGDVFNQDDAFIFIEVRAGASVGGYTGLLPRSPVTAAPKAQHATTADNLNGPAVINSDADQDTLTINLTNPLASTNSAALSASRGAVDPTPFILPRVAEFQSAGTPIGVLALADRFGIVGIMNANASPTGAAILGEVFSGGFASQAAVRALNSPAGTSASLAVGNLAGDFNGDIQVDGDIIKQYSPSSADLAVPIAYGFVNSNGTIASGTPNFSAVWNAPFSRYEIEISDETYFFSNYVTVVTPTGSGVTARTGSIAGRLIVDFRSTSTQAFVQSNFQFVTFKPDGAAAISGLQRASLQPLNTPYTDADLHPNPINPPPRTPIEPKPTPQGTARLD